MSLHNLRRLEFNLNQDGKRRHYPLRVKRVRVNRMLFRAAVLMAAAALAIFIYSKLVTPISFRWKGMFRSATPQGYSIHGIDISHHQGTIDWQKVRGANIGDYPVSFVIMKATEGGNYIDCNFADNWREAQDAGFICGAYHYFKPHVPAAQQADYFIGCVDLDEGCLAPVLDIEECGSIGHDALQAAALEWLRKVESHYGSKPIIYTNLKFKTTHLNDTAFNAYPLWIANYYADTLKYEGNWRLWQYTDNGRVKGISGRVDCNVYNGSMYDLQRFLINARQHPHS